MRFWFLGSYVCTLCVFISSCASERTTTTEQVQSTDIDKYMSDVSYQVKEDGSVQTSSDQRSSFERVANYSDIRQQRGSSFYTEGYSKKGWSQGKAYQAKAYYGGASGMQMQDVPHFAQQQSRMQGQTAYASTQGNYSAKGFYGGEKEVSRGRAQAKTVDVATQTERESSVAPPIRGYKEEQQLSVEDTNFMLGR